MVLTQTTSEEDTFAGDGMGMAGGEKGGSSAIKLVP